MCVYVSRPDATIARVFPGMSRPDPRREEPRARLGQGQQVAAPPASLPLRARKTPRLVHGIFRREEPTTETKGRKREGRAHVRPSGVCKEPGPAKDLPPPPRSKRGLPVFDTFSFFFLITHKPVLVLPCSRGFEQTALTNARF